MGAENPADRYSAHLGLADIGEPGQARIGAARIGLVGLGGLGCAVAPYLVAGGAGSVVLCDFDTVSASNLARQTLYTPADVGRLKTEAARQRLSAMNPDTGLTCIEDRVDGLVLKDSLDNCDLLIDASDNYGTRLAINRACLESGIPWIMGACIRMEGQVMLFSPGGDVAPCYRCVYGSAPDSLEDCPGAGIMSTVAGLVGITMAHLALTRLAGLHHEGLLHLLDGKTLEWRKLSVSRKPGCMDCGIARG